jgi:multimeric flavodoxin WrbA
MAGRIMRSAIGMSASCRAWGNCESAVKQILVSAHRAGAETGFVRLTDLKIEPCRGCFACLVKGGMCTVDDDLRGLLGRIASSDMLILAAPVYFTAPSSNLIALMDRLLVMAGTDRAPDRDRPAVTLTMMGNYLWRGVARPLVNMTASLLGFNVVESLTLVAEGPGEVIADSRIARRLRSIGEKLAKGQPISEDAEPSICPTCKSDFFRIEPPFIVCPVCGEAGWLEDHINAGRFTATGRERSWGLSWLDKHVESWIRPSLLRYKEQRRKIINSLRELKKAYSEIGERGETDV